MKKIWLLAALLCFLWFHPLSAMAADKVERVYGMNRFQTAVQVAFKINSGTVESVVLANGWSFADALAGVPLAKQKRARLLFVDDKVNNSWDALSYINKHLDRGGNIYLLGGTGVVPESFVDKFLEMGFERNKIHRLAGRDRYGTAVAIAWEIQHNGTEYFMASGENYPDALSGSVLAAVLGDITHEQAAYQSAQGTLTYPADGGVPLLLLPSDGSVPQSVVEYLNSVSVPRWLPKQFFNILGGNGVIPQATLDSLSRRVDRFGWIGRQLGGNDRYETMEAINRSGFEGYSGLAGKGYNVPHIYVAYGEDFPDALAGAVLAALNHAPLVLVNESIPGPVRDLLSTYRYENAESSSIATTLTVIGAPDTISEQTENELNALFD